jgi:hypothetical protein
MQGWYRLKYAFSRWQIYWSLTGACLAFFAVQAGTAQTGIQPPPGIREDKVANPTPINQPPDKNTQMKSRERRLRQRSFDQANALRLQQIADETVKLLILARDLKEQMDKIGDKPLPPDLARETEVIQLLAHDVQTKMTLMIGAS